MMVKGQALDLWDKFIESQKVEKTCGMIGGFWYYGLELSVANRIIPIKLVTAHPDNPITEDTPRRLHTIYGKFDLTILEATDLRKKWNRKDTDPDEELFVRNTILLEDLIELL